MPRMSSAERRDLIVQAALRVIARGGMAAATTRAIVAEADMSLASFHYAFRSHAEMMRELVVWVVDAEVAAVFSSMKVGRSIHDALRSGFQAYLDYLSADPGHEQVMQELVQYSLRTPGLEYLAAEQYQRYHAGVATLLTEGGAASGIQWAIPVADVARFVVTVTGGVTVAWLADRDTAAAGRVLDFAAESLSRLAVPVQSPSSVPTKETVA